ncbi:hypothetical protein [Methylovulum psychrotolerans]|uniref:hypothetical protein n=1 Tax=Methylovulum psychrotolerans TaxID=1704499 RepID=UPI0012F81FC9|nr:hypothetical protein [Methylovulum psychrotolerans]
MSGLTVLSLSATKARTLLAILWTRWTGYLCSSTRFYPPVRQSATLFQEYPCAQAHLVNHGGHLFEELAVFGVDGGQHHDLVAGVDFGAAEPAVGVLGVFEA